MCNPKPRIRHKIVSRPQVAAVAIRSHATDRSRPGWLWRVPCQNSHATSDLVSSLLIRLLAGTR